MQESDFYCIWIFVINVENETERGGFFCFLRHQISLDWRQDSFNHHLRLIKNAPNINSQQNRHPCPWVVQSTWVDSIWRVGKQRPSGLNTMAAILKYNKTPPLHCSTTFTWSLICIKPSIANFIKELSTLMHAHHPTPSILWKMSSFKSPERLLLSHHFTWLLNSFWLWWSLILLETLCTLDSPTSLNFPSQAVLAFHKAQSYPGAYTLLSLCALSWKSHSHPVSTDI